jgi:streptogramin lyase
MRLRYALFVAGAIPIVVIGLMTSSPKVIAQNATALTGLVSSEAEGKMEGVVVSARRDGANFTVSVVSDASGRYSFPKSHLSPGTYTLTMRAVGYDMPDPGKLEVTSGPTATRDLTLMKTKDLASQLSSLEWAISMSGTEEQKHMLVHQLLSCAYCHTYERIMKSKHSADEYVSVISRMQTYFNDGTALGRGNRGRAQRWENADQQGRGPTWGQNPPVLKTELGEYLATVNLSGGRTTWPYELRTLPRPKGKATRVIMTQYDMPRRDTVPHDFEIDAKGTPWYGDQSRMYIGKLDPKTGEFTEYPLPPLPPNRVGGISDTAMDNDGFLWFPMTLPTGKAHFGAPTRFDPRTKELKVVEGHDDVQFIAKGPDGKLVFNNTIDVIRVDPKALKIDARFKIDSNTPGAPPGRHSIYQTGVNSKGNIYAFDWLGSNIVGIDVATGAIKFYPTPNPESAPRRGKMDEQDRLWFAEYNGDRIAMFDTKTNQFKEWPVQKYTTPYAASVPDKNGYVFVSSNMSEQVLRLDTKSGEIIEYQVPTDFDSKEVILDPTASRTTVWMANTRNARLLKIEPLDE